MKGVILAAGEGKRLISTVVHGHKSLVILAGLSIIERILFTFSRFAVSDVIIIVGNNGDILRDRIGAGKRYGVSIQYVESKDWKKGSGFSLYGARDALRGESRFILSMGDVWFQPELMYQIMNNVEQENIVCVDKKPEKYNNIEGATKVKVTGSGFVEEIGRNLSDYNAIDCGIFIFSGDIFGALEESFEKGDYSGIGALRILAHRGNLVVHDIGDYLWQDIDTEDDLKEASKKIASSLRKSGAGLV